MTTLLLTDPTNPRCVVGKRIRTRTRLSAHFRAHNLDRHWPRVPICRRKVLRSRGSLKELAACLVRRDPVNAHGVAKASLLLGDGCGPVYGCPAADDLEPAVQQALQALEVAV
jgi:hypothetical protein